VAHRGRHNADDALALAVAAGRTLRKAAARAGVSERTAARRWADPAFRPRVAALRADLVRRALGRLAGGMAADADALRHLLGAASEPVRLGAACALLELGVRLRESVELEDRLRDLEGRLGEGGGEKCPSRRG
jgi:hypothetical protein